MAAVAGRGTFPSAVTPRFGFLNKPSCHVCVRHQFCMGLVEHKTVFLNWGEWGSKVPEWPLGHPSQVHQDSRRPTMRVLPIVMAAAIAGFATAAAAQSGTGPTSNQPPGQASTTQSSEQSMQEGGKMKKQHAMKKHHAKKAAKKKEM